VLKQRNVGKVYLYATHGIFSKGLDVLFDDGIDLIITTNSFYDDENEDPRLFVNDVFGV
jgi:ribose-phosphate pyrophosphokinase